MVDPERLRRLLVMLERYRDLLAEDAPDPYRRRHLVQTVAQISIDAANHVVASEGLRPPHDYGDTFRVLAESGLLDADLAGRLTSLAGARNLIVHLYAEVDDERLARSVREGGLDDVDAFARVLAILATRG